MEFTDEQFRVQVKLVYRQIVDLMQCKHIEVRVALHRIFLRLGQLFGLDSNLENNE